jgi:hypothetical protein
VREDQWATYVSVDGNPVPGPGITWDTCNAGDIDSDEVKYLPGGMGAQISLGGNPTISNITVGKLLVETSDWAPLKGLIGRQGKAPMVITRQPLDTDGNPYGAPLVYSGLLKTVMPPPHNSDGNTAAVWQLVQSTTRAA